MTRKVVKDPILKGQNRGEVEDRRADKMAELERYRRDNGHDAPRETVNGYAQITVACLVCGHRHTEPKKHAGGLVDTTCPNCGIFSTHEKV